MVAADRRVVTRGRIDAGFDQAVPELARWVTVIVPTRNEAGNVRALVARTAAALSGIDAELLFVDDSDDQTPHAIQAVAATSSLPVRLLHRPLEARQGGLGGAVQAGLAATQATWVVVMDGDLQHPPELIPLLLSEGVGRGLDVVVASRYRDGGAATGLTSPVRRLVSSGATVAARATLPRLLRPLSDPMSGFFALRRDVVDPAALRPLGFKILLEILVRSTAAKVDEVPYRFAERSEGQSKASGREAVIYLRQLVALRAATSKPFLTKLATFGAVGASGIVVNTALLWLLTSLVVHLPYLVASAVATQVAVVWNFALIERVVFRNGRHRRLISRFGRFWLLNLMLLPVQLALLAVAVEALQLPPVVSNIAVLGLVFVLRYVATAAWVYGAPAPARARTSQAGDRNAACYGIRLALPTLATIAAFPGLVLSLGGTGASGVGLSIVLLLGWVALWPVTGSPRVGEPDVHDRQVDVILGLPLLAAATWLSLSSGRTSLATAVTNDGVIALVLMLTGASLVLLGTRLTARLRDLLLAPLLALPGLTARPVLSLVLAAAVGLIVSRRVWHRWERRAAGAATGQHREWLQPLPRLTPSLGLVSAVVAGLAVAGALSVSSPEPVPVLDATGTSTSVVGPR